MKQKVVHEKKTKEELKNHSKAKLTRWEKEHIEELKKIDPKFAAGIKSLFEGNIEEV